MRCGGACVDRGRLADGQWTGRPYVGTLLRVATPNSSTTPVFRWAGGKQRLAGRILQSFPTDVRKRQYVEPFLGAGSMFFRLGPRRAVIGDSNENLMSCYAWLRESPELVARYLRVHVKNHSPRHYYQVRGQFNKFSWSAAQAARFIYLNRACFNGIYRVNTSGHFNVPFGSRHRARFPNIEHLRRVGSALRSAILRDTCFRETLSKAPRGCFAYIDPPYPPLNGTSFFQHYTLDRFSEDDQHDLADAVNHLDAQGTRFLSTNADTPLIRSLYCGYRIDRIAVPRWVSCKGTKHRVFELLIRNY